MLICRNSERVHGQRKVGNPWFREMLEIISRLLTCVRTNQSRALGRTVQVLVLRWLTNCLFLYFLLPESQQQQKLFFPRSGYAYVYLSSVRLAWFITATVLVTVAVAIRPYRFNPLYANCETVHPEDVFYLENDIFT